MRAVAFAVALVALSGCPITPRPGGAEVPDEGGIEERSELFVESLPGTVEFETNDPRFWGPYGYTLWALRGPDQAPFAGRTVTAAKVSGDGSAGFGVVFCAYDSADPLVGETMLVVMINTGREFIVGEVAGGEFREIVPWTSCAALRLGYGQENTIALAAGPGELVLSLNGSEAARFRDDEPPLHTGGGDGYIVVISPLDRFPDVPVHVVFREGS